MTNPLSATSPFDQKAPEPFADGGDPFDSASGVSGERMANLVGELLLITPLDFIPEFSTSVGKTDTVRVDLVILSGERFGEELPGMLVFQQALVRDLKNSLKKDSQYFLARLALGNKKPGQSAPYIFQQLEDADRAIGTKYLRERLGK